MYTNYDPITNSLLHYIKFLPRIITCYITYLVIYNIKLTILPL